MSTDTNLWETFLKESSKRARLPESTILFLGNTGCGKNKLMEKFRTSAYDPKDVDSNISKTEIISYDYFNAVDPDDGPADLESVSRVSVWSLNDQSFQDAVDLILEPTKIERFAVMIGVDLSKLDECAQSLRKWLRFTKLKLSIFAKKLLEKNADSQLCEAANALLNNTLIDPSAQSSDDKSGHSLTKQIANLGFPIIVIGCKSDILKVDDVTAMKRTKDVQAELRTICMEVGAGLVYTSAASDINCMKLQKYILSKLYPESICFTSEIEDGISTVFIPSGTDSHHLISISTGMTLKPDSFPQLKIDSYKEGILEIGVPDPSGATTNSTNNPSATTTSAIELEDEQTWLTTLHTYISEQVVNAATAPNQKASTSTTIELKSSTAAEQARRAKTRSTPRAAAAPGDHSNVPTEELKNFFENLLTNSNPAPKR